MAEFFNSITNWLSQNYGWVISISIQGFIAYHIFFLSKQLSNKEKLSHKERVKQKVEDLLAEIHKKGLNSEVYLVNINRYFKDYPANDEKILGGYSHIKAEVKSARFDGVEFFCSMPEQVYKKPNGKLSFSGEVSEKAFLAFPVGIVPYEWIEFIDLNGDEYGYVPLFFCRFKANVYWKKSWRRFIPMGYPYKKLVYYRESDVYHEGSDPVGMKYRFIDEPISRKVTK